MKIRLSSFLFLLFLALPLIGESGDGRKTDREKVSPGVTHQAQAGPETIVYVTKTGAKYHRAGCRSLSKSAIPMALKDAVGKYGPCAICKPPTLGLPASGAESPPVLSRKATATRSAGNGDVIVYVTRTGTKYHRAGCRSLARSSTPLPLKEAAARYGPCGVCKPPILERQTPD
jgi:hypothetical protein